MAWVRIDDQILEHPKFLTLNDAGWSLWVRTLVHANRYQTEGVLEAIVVKRLGTLRTARDLLRRGIWDPLPGGRYLIHDYHDYQLSAAQLAARAAAARAAARQRWADAKAHSKPHPKTPEIDAATHSKPHSKIAENACGLPSSEIPRSRDPEDPDQKQEQKPQQKHDLEPVSPIFAALRDAFTREKP